MNYEQWKSLFLQWPPLEYRNKLYIPSLGKLKLLVFFFFLNIFLYDIISLVHGLHFVEYVFAWKSHRERGRGLSFSDSLSRCPQWAGRARPMSGTGTSRFFPITPVGSRCWALLCCFSQAPIRQLDQRWSSQDRNWHPMWDAAIATGVFTHCATAPAPWVLFLLCQLLVAEFIEHSLCAKHFAISLPLEIPHTCQFNF